VSTQQVVQFEYQQSLAWESNRPRWSERIQASVRLTNAALTSGWLREHFSGGRGGAVDFLVLAAIVMHARPLSGDDLDYLVRLGMADLQDEGCLFARVTDLGLADELGVHRTTIAASAGRLASSGFIQVAEAPDSAHYQDSKGRFAGAKAYLLAGDIQQRFLKKDLQEYAAPSARAIDIGQADTLLLELVGFVETGRIIHAHPRAEVAIAQVRPVAHLAIADAHQVGQSIAAQVGEVDRLCTACKDKAWTFLFFRRLCNSKSWTKAFLSQGWMPDKDVIFGDHYIGMTIPIQIDKLQVWIANVTVEA
jgi:hypothetical protein